MSAREFKLVDAHDAHYDKDGNYCIKAESVSDGYHTMHELYKHRMALFVALCNFISDTQQISYQDVTAGLNPWKSKLHSDGTMFEGGYFIVGLDTPNGQITYHMKIEKWWDRFRVPELERAPEYDGHKSEDVIERLLKL